MNLARAIVEKRAGLRYRLAKAQMPLFRQAFAALGEGSIVIAPVMVQGAGSISLGSRVLIRDGAWLATEGSGTLTIGDNTYIGHRSHFHAIDPVSVGRRCVFADNVMITSSDHAREDRHAVQGTGAVVIGDDVFVGQNAVILGGVTVGSGATIAAGSVVTKDVDAGAVVGGVPARALNRKEPRP